MDNPINLCTTNQQVDSINNDNIDKLKTKRFTINCKDEGKKAKKADIHGLKASVQIAVGAFVMLTTNLNVSTGLVNGSTGIVRGIFVDENEKCCGCLVEFKTFKGSSNIYILYSII